MTIGLSSRKMLMENDSTKGFRVLVVAPGATTSTYDIFWYTLSSFREYLGEERVRGFYVHNSIMYHAHAICETFPNMEEAEVIQMAHSRAAMDILTDVLLNRPDVVHIVDGTIFPIGFYKQLYSLRMETHRRFIISVHLTEEPYASEYTNMMINWIDVVFVNDINSVGVIDPGDIKHVYYTPHTYTPGTHYVDLGIERDIDVFMCGSFYQERIDFLSQVDWSGINVKLIGPIGDMIVDCPEHFAQLVDDRLLANNELADYYRRSKIAINLHRTTIMGGGNILSGDAYSVSPRVIEAAACGALVLSDYRQELVDVFDGLLPMFSTPLELRERILYFLGNDQERQRLAMKSTEFVDAYSIGNRSLFMLEKFQDALAIL